MVYIYFFLHILFQYKKKIKTTCYDGEIIIGHAKVVRIYVLFLINSKMHLLKFFIFYSYYFTGVIGATPDGKACATMLEAAKSEGYLTG